MEKLFKISSSPHAVAKHSVQSIMRDVVIALIPALLVGVYFFGVDALVLVMLSVVSCVAFEVVWQKFAKQPVTIKDLSAVVTGLLLAFNLPSGAPVYIPIVGAFVAIILAKQFFGGIGQNFINPALAARAFLLAAYPGAMTTFVSPVDATTMATPLVAFEMSHTAGAAAMPMPSLMDVFIGNISGCIGEVSALAILLGGAYLLYRKVITWHIPVCYLGTIFVMNCLSGMGIYDSFYALFLGGAMLGAMFMATDYTTSPMTIKGQVIFAIGGGLIAAIIRLYGGYPEGVSYSILLMNLAVPLIDRYVSNTPFGRKRA